MGVENEGSKRLVSAAAAFAASPELLYGGDDEPPRKCRIGGGDAFEAGEKVVYTAALLGFWSGVGAWLGHRKQSESWSDAPVQRLKLTVLPQRGGGRVALSFSF